MSINARTEEFQHIELFDKYALFTNARIDRSTVPEGWYCYDFRGSDSDPGKLNYVELRVGVNHSGAVLLPEKLDMKGKDYRRVRGQINFLGSQMTLREFCEAHQLPYPEEKEQFHIRPARPDEAGLFYTPHPEEDKRRGTIGHIRMDFGRSGNEFWHTWWPRGPEELNSPVFKAELQEVEHYRYCLRCNPSPGDYNGYLTAYDLNVQRQNMAQDKPLVGRVTYANGDAQDFTDAEAFLKCLREELPYRPTTGFRYEVLTDDSAVRKAVDDIVFDLYGEENPRQQEDYEPHPEQNMTFGGM